MHITSACVVQEGLWIFFYYLHYGIMKHCCYSVTRIRAVSLTNLIPFFLIHQKIGESFFNKLAYFGSSLMFICSFSGPEGRPRLIPMYNGNRGVYLIYHIMFKPLTLQNTKKLNNNVTGHTYNII